MLTISQTVDYLQIYFPILIEIENNSLSEIPKNAVICKHTYKGFYWCVYEFGGEVLVCFFKCSAFSFIDLELAFYNSRNRFKPYNKGYLDVLIDNFYLTPFNIDNPQLVGVDTDTP